jgi:hypothetical protein
MQPRQCPTLETPRWPTQQFNFTVRQVHFWSQFKHSSESLSTELGCDFAGSSFFKGGKAPPSGKTTGIGGLTLNPKKGCYVQNPKGLLGRSSPQGVCISTLCSLYDCCHRKCPLALSGIYLCDGAYRDRRGVGRRRQKVGNISGNVLEYVQRLGFERYSYRL